MTIIPQHKIDRYVLPEPRHRKKSNKKRKRWKIEAKYNISKPKPKSPWMTGDRTVGRYVTKEDAEKAVARIKDNITWRDYILEIRKTS